MPTIQNFFGFARSSLLMRVSSIATGVSFPHSLWRWQRLPLCPTTTIAPKQAFGSKMNSKQGPVYTAKDEIMRNQEHRCSGPLKRQNARSQKRDIGRSSIAKGPKEQTGLIFNEAGLPHDDQFRV
jgi:hypothetical protein